MERDQHETALLKRLKPGLVHKNIFMRTKKLEVGNLRPKTSDCSPFENIEYSFESCFFMKTTITFNKYEFFFESALLRDCSLCWDRWNGT